MPRVIYKRNTRRANQKKHTKKKRKEIEEEEEGKEKVTMTGKGYENVDCRRSSPEFCTDSQNKRYGLTSHTDCSYFIPQE